MTQAFENYRQAVDFLMGRINYERLLSDEYSTEDLKLGRMRQLLCLLGNPHESLPAVHIAGTKGKGSTAMMTAAILSAAGYRVGLFTSPHISRLEERMTVDGFPPSEVEVAALVSKMRDALLIMDAQPAGSSPTYFEILTAVAWLHFSSREVDIVVLEVGLGGRLDATNLCRPAVTVITSISFDHTRLLGSTLEKIATEKAGILKSGIPLISGVTDSAPQSAIRKIADERQVPVLQLGEAFDFEYEPLTSKQQEGAEDCWGFVNLSVAGRCIEKLPLSVMGRHQAHNAALAVAAVLQLNQAGWQIPEQALYEGLVRVQCPVRMEVVQRNPTVILDAAHNVASIQAFVETLDTHFSGQQKGLIFASTKDKPVKEMLKLLLPWFEWVVLTQYCNNPRGMDYTELMNIACSISEKELFVVETPHQAWEFASARSDDTEMICVTGSFFIAAELRDLLLLRQDQPGATGLRPQPQI